ncbi:hypothetical protein B0H16DRAFT_1822919 [Mycena metata]|uniref:Uncharacterized protein n=1 Tax=Mycena metata TaxID=1033252 RepID=A0AAD7GZ62_9AGAR|nr:hypothetical protein B0H16DRAFT_1822919 [Mycena metata]
MEEILRVLQGTTVAFKRPPASVKLAPSDNGQSLAAVFFEHPETYEKHVRPDGRTRSWGLYPMMHQMTYVPLNWDTKLVRPEDQFMSGVLARRKLQLKQVDLGDLTHRDYVLRIHMPGGMSLGVLQDKVLAPLMGWVRNFHAHILTDYRDNTQYGPKNSTAIDMMHIDASGYDFLEGVLDRGFIVGRRVRRLGFNVGWTGTDACLPGSLEI